MGYYYTVVKGDCLYNIAKERGFSHWRTIYDHPQNADFRKLRPDPNLIFPGDKLFIPDREIEEKPGGTEKKHKFKKKVEKAYLNLVIEDEEGKPLEGTYKLDVEGVVQKEGDLEEGKISTEIPMDARTGTLICQAKDAPPGVAWTWTLLIGELDPLETVSGVQGRLWNLGHECGPVDNIEGKLTRAGVKSFQKMAFTDEKEWDGIAGPKTEAKLREHHRV